MGKFGDIIAASKLFKVSSEKRDFANILISSINNNLWNWYGLSWEENNDINYTKGFVLCLKKDGALSIGEGVIPTEDNPNVVVRKIGDIFPIAAFLINYLEPQTHNISKKDLHKMRDHIYDQSIDIAIEFIISDLDKQNEIRMKAEDQAKGLGSMQYSTDTADKEEDNQVYEIAEMAIKYRPEVKKAYDDLREYPEEVKFTFLKNMNENPKQNPDDLFKKIIKEYDEKRNPFALEVTNTAYKSILEIDKKLAQEFINIVNILGEKNINPNFVKNDLIASATLIIEEGVIRSEAFKFSYAYKIKNNGVFLIQDEKGNWLEFEGEQAAREKLYIPKFITKTIKN
jgi:hypothetical protein